MTNPELLAAAAAAAVAGPQPPAAAAPPPAPTAPPLLLSAADAAAVLESVAAAAQQAAAQQQQQQQPQVVTPTPPTGRAKNGSASAMATGMCDEKTVEYLRDLIAEKQEVEVAAGSSGAGNASGKKIVVKLLEQGRNERGKEEAIGVCLRRRRRGGSGSDSAVVAGYYRTQPSRVSSRDKRVLAGQIVPGRRKGKRGINKIRQTPAAKTIHRL